MQALVAWGGLIHFFFFLIKTGWSHHLLDVFRTLVTVLHPVHVASVVEYPLLGLI